MVLYWTKWKSYPNSRKSMIHCSFKMHKTHTAEWYLCSPGLNSPTLYRNISIFISGKLMAAQGSTHPHCIETFLFSYLANSWQPRIDLKRPSLSLSTPCLWPNFNNFQTSSSLTEPLSTKHNVEIKSNFDLAKAPRIIFLIGLAHICWTFFHQGIVPKIGIFSLTSTSDVFCTFLIIFMIWQCPV